MNYKLIEASPGDADWVNELTLKAMKPYVEESWQTEKERQHYFSLNSFDPDHTKIITVEGVRAGRLTVYTENNVINLAELHISPEFHGRGIGTGIIKDTVADAFSKSLPVELKCLKTNPVKNLYKRLGFKLVKEDSKRLYFRIEAGQEEA